MKINSYISVPFLLIFLPIVVILYSAVPKKAKPYILLLASVIFSVFLSSFLTFYLVFTVLSIYFCALAIEKLKKKQALLVSGAESREEKKLIKKKCGKKQLALLVVFVVINILILALLKYSPFFFENIRLLVNRFKSDFNPVLPKFAAPVGISFYTLQAVSYIHDVYKGKIEAEHNLGKLALFVSFFPAIMEGPICRYSQTSEKLWAGESISYRNLTFGIQRIFFGMLKKIVIADRLNLVVTTIFKDFEAYHYDGGIIALGAILYTIELYSEFSGTMDVVIGTAEIFGITLPENFRQPFFSKSISEFWQRWHITLGTWFRDYVFYPVTMSTGMKKLTRSCRKKLGRSYGPLPASIVAFFCVWLCNGIWHGAGWQYVFFGMYHFVLISLGALITPASNALFEKLKIDKNKLPYKIFAIVRTAILVFIGEMFFNSRGITQGFKMFKIMVSDFSLKSIFNGSVLTLGIDAYDIAIVVISLVIVLIVGLMKEKGISPREYIAEKPIFIRWPIYLSLILFIAVFGAYGAGYVPIDPIYANF